MENDYLYWNASSNIAILRTMGEFIRFHRLKQNKTQSQLAEEAGINRTTLVEFEQGKRSNTLTLVQLLRALNQLPVLSSFQIDKEPSPLQLAKLEQKERKRASRNSIKEEKPKSDW
jgi:transcriptional regulator with XRE-family HTH domain